MLKVVGASWEQTRVSGYILVAFALFGLLIFIFGERVPHYSEDGNYAATVFWTKDVGFYDIEFWGQGNVLLDLPQGTARGYHKQNIANIGWSKLEIETNPEYPDNVQAYSAGMLEGSLTWQLIYWRWRNNIDTVCDENYEACDDIRKRLSAWGGRMREKAEELSHLEPFWHQVHLFFCQLDGVLAGWTHATKRNRLKDVEIEYEDFLWLNLLATDVPLPDVPTLVPRTPSLSSSLIKIHTVNDTAQIIAAQTTANAYRDLLRIGKRYVFHYRLTSSESSGVVPGTVLEFTGYPGALSSQDDIYAVNSKYYSRHNLLVIGSTIGHGFAGLKESKKNKKKRFVEERVAGSIRGLVATRLARDGRKWAAHFNRGRGGASIDRQWQIVDVSKIDNKESDGLLWIVEQGKGVIYASDKTENFRTNSYWATYGLPYHQDIRLSMNLPPANTLDELYSYVQSPRGKMFTKCRENCTSTDEIFYLIRNAVPVNQNLLGARPDLYEENPTPFGIVDTKVVTVSRTSVPIFELTAGPVHSLNISSNDEGEGFVAPFQWSTSPFFRELHIGQPDIWSYQSYTPTWAGY